MNLLLDNTITIWQYQMSGRKPNSRLQGGLQSGDMGACVCHVTSVKHRPEP